MWKEISLAVSFLNFFQTVHHKTDTCLNPDSQQKKTAHVLPVGWVKSILSNDHAGSGSRDAGPVHSWER